MPASSPDNQRPATHVRDRGHSDAGNELCMDVHWLRAPGLHCRPGRGAARAGAPAAEPNGTRWHIDHPPPLGSHRWTWRDSGPYASTRVRAKFGTRGVESPGRRRFTGIGRDHLHGHGRAGPHSGPYRLLRSRNNPSRTGTLLRGCTLWAGCGRLFEGTPEQALQSLKKLTRLPAETQVYCAHEYTLANLRFARQVEPGNAALAQRLARDEQRLASTGTTLPTTMVEELATNPFLRCTQASVKSQMEAHCGGTLTSETEVFAALRRWKDVS